MARYVKRKPKIFVLDTNIILHDYKAIRKFQDNDVVIPVVVIEELDKFKKGNDQLAFNARGFMRDIDRITEGKTFGKDGVQIAKGLGRIKIEPNHPFPPDMEGMFYDDIPDHRILATAIWVRDNNPDRFVALVTKDINLRMKSKAAGMEVQDYLTDRVEEDKIENSNKEVQYLDGISLHAIQDLAYGPENSVPWNAVAKKEPRPNQLYKIKNGDETICARYDADRGRIILVKNYSVYGIRPRNHEQKFAIEDDRRRRNRKDLDRPCLSLGTSQGLRPDHPDASDHSPGEPGNRIPSGRPEEQDESVHPASHGQLERYTGPVQDRQQGSVEDRCDAQGREAPDLSSGLYQGTESRQGVLYLR